MRVAGARSDLVAKIIPRLFARSPALERPIRPIRSIRSIRINEPIGDSRGSPPPSFSGNNANKRADLAIRARNLISTVRDSTSPQRAFMS
jgi:hypothetical protein